ncbi:hypothetical protein A0Y90_01640 [Campylobacter upsaliensis]|uniref:hypothetical protein n=1 Tax=Campylobacter upsaliensis TaxID=28080 RepID=UPI00127BF09A|nr:hypothetical protein [Campylobacter upsaliensis]EAK0965149.1 hypothetical protein [Campylobacter upsaliensis]EAL3922495.1 hypothetical protein [Campylobacter upsaliensis]EIO6375506.1 hypothetical protein [Campylobacter upsaliensis]EIT6713902.1 hypothetical protein [Campylobacter upsaliensis]EJT2319375.1 hypothetical protein [Campylobacter upsaliensis]
MDILLIYYFAFLTIFGLLGLKFQKKSQTNNEKFYHFCPCKKMVENGSLSMICMYSAMGGFLYSATSLSFIGFVNLELNALFALSLLCAYVGWRLKKE